MSDDRITPFAKAMLAQAKEQLEGPQETILAACLLIGHLIKHGLKEGGDKDAVYFGICKEILAQANAE